MTSTFTDNLKSLAYGAVLDPVRTWKRSTLHHEWAKRAEEAGEKDVLLFLAQHMAKEAIHAPHYSGVRRGLCPGEEPALLLSIYAVRLNDEQLVPFEITLSGIGQTHRNLLDRSSDFIVTLSFPFENDSLCASDPEWQAMKTESYERARALVEN
jgi:hypothetical protein